MADSAKVTDVSAVTVSAKVLANIIGVGDRQVRNLADEGILVRNSHGRYLLEKSVKNYIKCKGHRCCIWYSRQQWYKGC